MSRAIKVLAMALVAGATLTSSACYGPGTTYVGVSGPGPWVGYPYPGRYPPYGGGGVWVGVPVCCDAIEAPLQEQPEEQRPEQVEKEGEAETAPEEPSRPADGEAEKAR